MLDIAKAHTADILHLQQLIKESVTGLSTGFYSTAQIESALIYVFGIDTQLIADGTYFIARWNGKIAGCGGWSKRNTLFGGDQTKGIEDPLLNPEKDAARIRAFFVHPDFARKGVGTALLNICAENAYSNGFRNLELAATLPGIPFYLKLGFKKMEDRNILLADGQILQLSVMQKSI